MNTKRILAVLLIASLFSVKSSFSQNSTRVIITDVNNEGLTSKMQANASELLTAINTAFLKKNNPKPSSVAISKDVMPTLLAMWEMSNFKCSSTEISERAIKRAQGGYEVRNIPVFMAEASKDDQNQEIVLIFTSEGIIDNIYISMESNRYNQLIGEGVGVTDFKRRQILLDFVENFRTAYNRKDIDFLDKVYSEDALIITGKVVKVSPANKDMSKNYLSTEIIQYQKQTKSEYISKLKSIFANNSYINVKFDDIEIKKHNKYPTIYGVNMMQSWNTKRYSDEGYLFLMIDFSNEDNPLIHVRTWQPNRIGGKSLGEEEKFKLENFKPKI